MADRSQAGQALAEFALCVPVLLLLILGLLQLALLGLASLACHQAVENAARVYAVRAAEDPDEALEAAAEAAGWVLARCRPSPSFELRLLNADEAWKLSGDHGARFGLRLSAELPLFLPLPRRRARLEADCWSFLEKIPVHAPASFL